MAANGNARFSSNARAWVDKEEFYQYEDYLLWNEINKEKLPRVKAFDFDDSDVLISTYPRSGTTWTQEMTWLICNNADTEGAKTTDLIQRSPFIEYQEPPIGIDNIDILESQPPPRVIKTHLPPQFFTKYGKGNFKTIVVMRNLKDVIVSCFHFYKNLCGYNGDWDEYFELVLADTMYYGSWLKHCLKCWELRDDPHVLTLRYEDMKRDHVGTIRKIADYLGKSLTENQVQTITDYTTVGNMRKVFQSTNVVKHDETYKDFIRKGGVGEWSKWMSEEQLGFVNGVLKEAEERGLVFADQV